MANTENSLLQNSYNYLEVDKFLKTMKKWEVFPERTQEKLKGKDVLYEFITDVFIVDKNENIDVEAKKRYLEVFPAGTSYKVFSQFTQSLRKRRFCQYDYGLLANMALYNIPYPPDYPLGCFPNIPTLVLIGKNDTISTFKDATLLKEKIKKTDISIFEISNVSHFGFLIGSKSNLFEEGIKEMMNFSKKYFDVNAEIILEKEDNTPVQKKEKGGIVENGINQNKATIEEEEKREDL